MRTFFILLLFMAAGKSYALIPDRRPAPEHKAFGYLIYPIAGHIPGAGSGYGAGALINNIFHSDTRFVAFAATGDVTAYGINFNNINLLGENLRLSMAAYDAATTNRFYERGMLGSPENYGGDVFRNYGGSAGITLNLWDKRIVFWGRVGKTKASISSVKGPSGEKFKNNDQDTYDNPYARAGFRLDLTDHWIDPRKGIRFTVNRVGAEPETPTQSKYHHWTYSTTGYIPVGKQSTWAFNYFRSASYVDSESQKSQADLTTEIGLDCGSVTDPTLNAECQRVQSQRIQSRLLGNRHGSSSYLGGEDRLRSFPLWRYTGSQTIFYGTEFRWNLTDEKESMDLGFISGVRSTFQLAFFHEQGAVSDPPVDIYSAPLRHSSGVGIRLIFSGAVIRAEAATGSEGPEFLVFYGFPWGLPLL